MLKTNVHYILLCALRDRLFLGLIAGVLLATFFASFMGSAAFLENKEMSLTMTASVSRFILVIGSIVFICFQVRSHFDNKEMDVMLTRPLPRDAIVLSYWLGFALVSTLVCVPLVLVVAIIGPLSWSGFALWAVSLILEIWIVAAVALFCSMVLKSAVVSVLSSLGLYVLGRMMILFIMSAEHTVGGIKMWLGGKILQGISIVMPRLDFFAKSEWLVYGIKQGDAWNLVLVQLAIYVPLLVLATVIDFRKKQF